MSLSPIGVMVAPVLLLCCNIKGLDGHRGFFSSVITQSISYLHMNWHVVCFLPACVFIITKYYGVYSPPPPSPPPGNTILPWFRMGLLLDEKLWEILRPLENTLAKDGVRASYWKNQQRTSTTSFAMIDMGLFGDFCVWVRTGLISSMLFLISKNVRKQEILLRLRPEIVFRNYKCSRNV